MNLRGYKSISERRSAVEKLLKLKLNHIGSFSLDESVAASHNCENMIGISQIPMGLAGPVQIKSGSAVKGGEFYLPLATTEGALVASVSRGAKAISQSGGANTDSYQVGVTRGPVFKVENLKQSDKLNNLLTDDLPILKKIVIATSGHLMLKNIFSRGVGKYRYVRFVFDPQDAMGMNMATIASVKLVDYLEKQSGAKCVSVAGNYDVDKKPAWLNFIEGRGIKIWAEVTLPERVLQNTLKTTAAKIYETWLSKCMLGSAMSGSMGFNGHYANITAAIFAATGQDLAHVSESSLGITTAEVKNGKDLYFSIYLPDLMIGTVGGGTGLSTQKEALSIIGVSGGANGKNVLKFAEIIAAAVLAGELSLLASLSEGTLAKAHARLARGGKL